jgi:hypothetical protein
MMMMTTMANQQKNPVERGALEGGRRRRTRKRRRVAGGLELAGHVGEGAKRDHALRGHLRTRQDTDLLECVAGPGLVLAVVVQPRVHGHLWRNCTRSATQHTAHDTHLRQPGGRQIPANVNDGTRGGGGGGLGGGGRGRAARVSGGSRFPSKSNR